MLVCSISTLLLNGNPLLRYDGYYVLADFLEVPNLAEQSRAVLGRVASLLFLGMRQPSDRMGPDGGQFLLGLYGLASLAYRCVAVCVILWVVHRVAQSCGVAALGDALVIVLLAGILLPPARRAAAFFSGFGRGCRAAVAGTGSSWPLDYGASGFGAGSLALPRCRAAGYRTRERPPTLRRRARRMNPFVSTGDRVENGQEVARLANPDIRLEIVELTGKRGSATPSARNSPRAASALDPHAAALIPTAEAALGDLDQRLRQRQRDEERLVLRAA